MDQPNEPMQEATPQEKNMETLMAQVQELTRQLSSLPHVFERLGRLEQAHLHLCLKKSQRRIKKFTRRSSPTSQNRKTIRGWRSTGSLEKECISLAPPSSGPWNSQVTIASKIHMH
eukprot:scaffold7_cov414-Pavlova_lutheri.AAC.22